MLASQHTPVQVGPPGGVGLACVVIFSYLVLKFQEFTVPYLRPEKAVELKTNQVLQVRSFVKLV